MTNNLCGKCWKIFWCRHLVLWLPPTAGKFHVETTFYFQGSICTLKLHLQE